MSTQSSASIELANQALDLAAKGELESAIAALENVIAAQPDMVGARINLGALLCRFGAIERAINCLKTALELAPKFPAAWNNYGHALLRSGAVEAAFQAFSKAIEYDPLYISAHSNRILTTLYRETSLELRQRVQDDYRCAITQKIATFPAYQAPRKTAKYIKIGFISPDFRQHSVAFFLESIFKTLDKRQFQLHLYADNEQSDPYTETFQRIACKWHPCSQLNDAELTQLIRQHSLDVLFDLCGHFSHNRQAVIAARAAPIQSAWLGYPGISHTPNLDFYLADSIVLEKSDLSATERKHTYALPQGFHCYCPPQDAPAITSAPCTKNRHFTFGCFNNLFKMSPQIAGTWGQILRLCPHSQLILKSAGLDSKIVQKRILTWMQLAPDEHSRVHFLGRTPSFSEHLKSYNKIDLALDSYPYNGTTTTCEALWMGVPTISLSGTQIQSRIGASLLTQVGLEHFCVASHSHYTALAQQLYKSPDKLARLRSGLRARVQASSLIDPELLTKSLSTFIIKTLDTRVRHL
jgi:predicted O-linked N-acetylglucosamine transferase (SPINDLY family)